VSRVLARDLHPVAWWTWAIGLAVASSATTNPWVQLLLVAVTVLVVAACRSDHPWSRSFRLYLTLGAAIVVLRVGWRLLVGGSYPGVVVLDLPRVPLPDWVLGISLLGPVTREALLAGLYDGLRLATIVICVGAANSLANPKRLLRSLPPALHEVGTALVVAVTVLPQLTASLARVRAAQRLRAGEDRRVRGLRRLLVPVLEDTLERSLALAAGMDTRGYGRAGPASPAQRRTTGTLMATGLVGVLVGTYLTLDRTIPQTPARLLLVIGVLLAVAGLVVSGRRVPRTRYRPDPWLVPETLVAASGLTTAAVGLWVAHHQVPIAFPDVTSVPQVSLVLLLGALVGALAALVAPPPRRVAT